MHTVIITYSLVCHKWLQSCMHTLTNSLSSTWLRNCLSWSNCSSCISGTKGGRGGGGRGGGEGGSHHHMIPISLVSSHPCLCVSLPTVVAVKLPHPSPQSQRCGTAGDCASSAQEMRAQWHTTLKFHYYCNCSNYEQYPKLFPPPPPTGNALLETERPQR